MLSLSRTLQAIYGPALSLYFLLSPAEAHKLCIMVLECICDMIKGNESDVGNIEFELQAKRGNKFLCFTLFPNLKNCLYL